MRLVSLAMVGVALWVSGAAAALGPIRPEFQVSTGPRYSYYSYTYPHNEAAYSIDIGASHAGTFVVVWEDLENYIGYYSRPGIFARRFNSQPIPLGREFRTTRVTSYIRGSSHVASDKDGNFVVVWDESDYSYYGVGDTDGLRVMAQRFNVNGGKVGPPFQVNTFTSGDQYTPKVGFDGAGNFVVVWAYYDYDYAFLAGQKYAPNGTAIGGEFQVNTYTSGYVGYSGLEYPGIYDDIDVAGDDAGNFVVVWRGPPGDPDGVNYESIAARFFNSAGTPLSDQFLVSTITTLGQFTPAVRSDNQGNFIVAWAQDYWTSIYARRFDAAGTPLGPEFKVNDEVYPYSFDFTDGPSIAADATGRFVVVWEEYYSQDDSIRGREFDPMGVPVANEFRIDVPDYYYNRRGKVATSAAGDFVVVWGQLGSYESYVWSAVGRKLGEQAAPCSPTPLAGCRETTDPGSGVLTFKKSANSNTSRLTWRFAKGPAQVAFNFGDPFTTDSYSVCLYDGSADPQPLYAAPVPASGTCGSVPCWREVGRGGGIDYYDPKQQFVEGIIQIRLTPGSEGRARGFVKGRGAKLSLPDTPLTAPVTFQLQGSHGDCWSGTYSQITKNDGGSFKAKPD
jgi:hypothetical protein